MKVDFEKLEKKEDPRIKLVERFRRVKELKGWTQIQLAEAMHITRQTVAGWLNGKKLPKKIYCSLIEEILKKYKM